jgi:hypothetical protein
MSNYGESEDVQFEFCASLLQVLDRRPVIPDGISMNDIDFINSTTVVKRQELRTRIETMRREIAEHNAHIHELHASGRFPTVNKLLLPVDDPGAALDGTLLHCFISGQTNDVPVQHKHEIKERLWTLGCVFRSMHNALWPDKGKYGKLATILRKCFMRIQYIAGDHIKDAIHFVNISSYELEGSNVTQICSAIESNISHSLSFRH